MCTGHLFARYQKKLDIKPHISVISLMSFLSDFYREKVCYDPDFVHGLFKIYLLNIFLAVDSYKPKFVKIHYKVGPYIYTPLIVSFIFTRNFLYEWAEFSSNLSSEIQKSFLAGDCRETCNSMLQKNCFEQIKSNKINGWKMFILSLIYSNLNYISFKTLLLLYSKGPESSTTNNICLFLLDMLKSCVGKSGNYIYCKSRSCFGILFSSNAVCTNYNF